MNNYSPNGFKPKSSPSAAPIKAAPDLRAKFNLPAQAPGVAKIASLVDGREKASMDEITDILKTETGVTQRLISLAYPRKDARLGATVQMATSRLGVNRVIVVLVGELLTKAVIETFETMLAMPMELEENSAGSQVEHGYLAGSVRFSGKAEGMVTLAFSPHFSLTVAGHLLGGNLDDEYPPEAINDVIGELVNIVTGNMQSKLCDAGLTSEVGLPVVTFQRKLPEEAVAGGSMDHFFFRHGLHTLAVCLSLDPSAQPVAAPKAPTTYGTTWRANRP